MLDLPTQKTSKSPAMSLQDIKALAQQLEPGLSLAEYLKQLVIFGFFKALLPEKHGGAGIATDAVRAPDCMDFLRILGNKDLSLGRCIEGHINVIRLMYLYATPAQFAAFAMAVQDGALAGIWVTDSSSPVHLKEYTLSGVKGFGSAIHLAQWALITAQSEANESLMLFVRVGDKQRIGPGPGTLSGMRESDTGSYDFNGLEISPEAIIGQPGDYLRQPEFSAGAWRGSAVALGGIDRLVDLLRHELRVRHRTGSPFQQERVGHAMIARETAAMWTARAAMIAYDRTQETGDISAIVNLARIAVEQAGLQIITLVQRGLGLSAFLQNNPVEKTMRDLAVYLRQPAPDETLTEAAVWFIDREPPIAGWMS